MAHLWRLRVGLADRAGALGQAASMLGIHGGNIVLIDVHKTDGTKAVDDLVVDFPGNPDLDEIRHDLATSAGAELLGAGLTEAVDPVVDSFGQVAALLDTPPDDPTVVAAMLTKLCPSSSFRLVDAHEARQSELGRMALEHSGPVGRTTLGVPDAAALSAHGEGPLIAASVGAEPGDGPVAFLRRDPPLHFTTTEASRVEALLRLYRRILKAGLQSESAAREASPPPDGR